MAETLPPCCQRARQAYVGRVTKTIMSYPVIKDIPCPTCRRVIPIRLYAPPSEVRETPE